ncbi:hypothetical protein BJV77DRAFT_1056083 [Russula vinacea]|nr:hypothetical protein BJV77DRAFT_1056083 [Russula vinacea]
MESWGVKYVGNAHYLLYEYLADFREFKNIYARFTSIVQSSGMGKSRTVDELSRKHLVVPLCLREGWRVQIEAFTRAGAFLCALFVNLLHYLQHIDAKIANIPRPSDDNEIAESLAAKFRLLMTAGQRFSSHGEHRKQFYQEVMLLADQIWSPTLTPGSPGKSPKFTFNPSTDANGSELMRFLIEDYNVGTHYSPALIISFDEAHSLAIDGDPTTDGPWSIFTQLRRALREIHKYPCFSIFLSTTGKIDQFMPAAKDDPSNRIQEGLGLIPPFCELGFDQLAEKATGGVTTLTKVSSEEFMASLGRPLFASRYSKGSDRVQGSIINFAVRKLLCKQVFRNDDTLTDMEKLACMTVRIPLEFNARILSSKDRERTLVEKHMRVCLPSCLVMRNPNFDLPRCLLAELEHPGLDKGSRGEIIVMTICLEARDAAVKQLSRSIIPVKDYIKALIANKYHDMVLHSAPRKTRTSDDAARTLADTFCSSNIYFNHFVKFRDRGVIGRDFLWRLIARGAAAICTDGQPAIDVIIPFLYKDEVLRKENVSAFLIQSKNDRSFQAEPDTSLFDSIRPHNIGFFDRGETNTVPIIRMVFALASSTSSVTTINPPQRKQPPRTSTQNVESFTAFDIWCAKASHDTFESIKDDDVFQKLLLRSYRHAEIYTTKRPALEAMTRSMNPASESNAVHWRQFSSPPPPPPP